jgi:hypothetical protein
VATYQSEAARIARQRALAEALRASGNEALPASIRTSGRFDAPVSGWQHANKALQQLLGGYTNYKADKAQKDLDTQDKQVLADLLNAKRAAQAPDVNGELDPAIQSDAGPTPVPAASKPLSKAEREAKLQAALMRGMEFGGSSTPYAQEMTERELFPAVQQPYTLNNADGSEMRYSGDNIPIAAGLSNDVPKETAEDRMLIDIEDPAAPGGRRTIKRSEWNGEPLWHKPTGGSGADDATMADLDEEALDNAVLDVMRDPNQMKQYATFGRPGQAIRTKINNAQAKKMKELGITNNQLAAFRSRVQGELKSTKGLVEMQNAVASYKKLARFNGDRLLELVADVDVTGVPAIEGLARWAKERGGSVDTAEFQSVLKTYQTEVARIIAQPRLIGQLTDTQIQEMQKVVSGTASAPQLRRVIGRLNLEMDMREKGIEAQIATSGGNLNIPGTEAVSPSAGGPTAGTVVDGYRFKGGDPNKQENWEPVQ